MEVLVCVTCALCAGMSAWLLLGGFERAGSARLHAYAESATHLVRRCVEGVGSQLPLESLLRWKAFASACDRVAAGEVWGGERPSRRIAAGILVLATVCCCLLGGLLTWSWWGAVVTLGIAVIGMQTWETSQARRLAAQVSGEMPHVLRTLSASLESGQTLVQAIERVGLQEHGPVGDCFVRASLRLRCGDSLEEALDSLATELDAPGVGLMTTALAISQRTGSPLRDLLQRCARLVERQGEQERLLRVRTAQARLSARIVCGLPPLMVLALSLLSSDFMEGLETITGMTCLLVAALMDFSAVLIIRRIMGGAL